MNPNLRSLRLDLMEIANRYGDAMGSDRDIRRLALIMVELIRELEYKEGEQDAKRGRPQGA